MKPLFFISTGPLRAATINVRSGVLGIVWAVESGERAPRTLKREVRELPGTAMGHGGGVVRVAPGRYDCWTDEVSCEDGDARRLTLRLEGSSPQVTPASR